MYRQCTTEKTAQQQRMFEDCLLQKMLKQSFHEISITGLCEETGLTRKIFYRLFDRKEDVLSALIDHTLEDYVSYIPGPGVTPGGLHRFLSYWRDQHELLEALVQNDMYILLWEHAIRHILREDSDIQEVFCPDAPHYAREIIIFYVSGLFVLILDWHVEGYRKSIDEMSELLMHIMTTSPAKGPLASDPNSHPENWVNGIYSPSHEE